MHRFLILGAIFAGTMIISPANATPDEHRDKRYYDRDGHDYHTWDNKEDRAYRIYLDEHHRAYREFKNTKAAEQHEYFKWRHDHPDHVLLQA